MPEATHQGREELGVEPLRLVAFLLPLRVRDPRGGVLRSQ